MVCTPGKQVINAWLPLHKTDIWGPQCTASSLAVDMQGASGFHVSDQAVRNRLPEHRMNMDRAKHPAIGPILTQAQRRGWLEF